MFNKAFLRHRSKKRFRDGFVLVQIVPDRLGHFINCIRIHVLVGAYPKPEADGIDRIFDGLTSEWSTGHQIGRSAGPVRVLHLG